MDGFAVIVASCGDEYAGLLIIETRPDTCEIHDFYIAPEWRNAQVAKKLLNTALPLDRKIVFNVFKANPRAGRFFEFLFKHRGMVFRKSGSIIWGVDCNHYEVWLPDVLA